MGNWGILIVVLLGLSNNSLRASNETHSKALVEQTSSQSHSSVKKCSSLLKNIKTLVTIATIATTILIAPATFHSINASSQNRTHLGYGIYYSWNDILQALSPSELELIKHPRRGRGTASMGLYSLS